MSRSPGLAPSHGNRPAENVHGRQWRVQDVIGGIVVVDCPVEPFAAMNAEGVARLDLDLGRNVGVPPVVADDLLVGELLAGIEWENYLRHQIS